MGRLIFIGTGLMGGDWITTRGIEAARRVDFLFSEFYTSHIGEEGVRRLEGILGRRIVRLSRDDVEMKDRLFRYLEEGDVGLLVGGDPMAATTHVELRLEAERRGHRTEVIYGVSIFSAAPSSMGLQHYKFGRVVSVPWVSEKFMPRSVLEGIEGNLRYGLHTLLLLDLKDEGRFMTVNECLRTLLKLEERHQMGVVDGETLVVGAARIGHPTEYIKGGVLAEIMEEDFGPPLHIVVIPGRLHFVEEDALRTIAGVKEGSLERWRDKIENFCLKGTTPS